MCHSIIEVLFIFFYFFLVLVVALESRHCCLLMSLSELLGLSSTEGAKELTFGPSYFNSPSIRTPRIMVQMHHETWHYCSMCKTVLHVCLSMMSYQYILFLFAYEHGFRNWLSPVCLVVSCVT